MAAVNSQFPLKFSQKETGVSISFFIFHEIFPAKKNRSFLSSNQTKSNKQKNFGLLLSGLEPFESIDYPGIGWPVACVLPDVAEADKTLLVDNKNARTRDPFVRMQDAVKLNDLPFGVGQDVVGELQGGLGLDGCF